MFLCLLSNLIGTEMYQLNNSVAFPGKPIVSEEFLNRKVEALGIIALDIIIDRNTKGRLYILDLKKE